MNENFYPFGVSVGDAQVPVALDGSSPPISLFIPFQFFDTSESTLFVSQLLVFIYMQTGWIQWCIHVSVVNNLYASQSRANSGRGGGGMLTPQVSGLSKCETRMFTTCLVRVATPTQSTQICSSKETVPCKGWFRWEGASRNDHAMRLWSLKASEALSYGLIFQTDSPTTLWTIHTQTIVCSMHCTNPRSITILCIDNNNNNTW